MTDVVPTEAKACYCPRCGYRLDYCSTRDICPECGLDIGPGAMTFRARRLWGISEKGFYYIGAILLAIAWLGILRNSGGIWSWIAICALGLSSFGALNRVIGFLRFVHSAEYLIVNQREIAWVIQGRSPVLFPWTNIKGIKCFRFFDWVVLSVDGGGAVRFVPARFRPPTMTISEMGQIMRDYWCRCREAPRGQVV